MGWSAVIAVIGAAVSYDSAQTQAKATKNASEQASQNARAQMSLQEQQINKANAQAPNTSAIMSANMQAAKAGSGSTMLTGSQGVDPNTLSLGKSTLLGS
jgi:hypothetical protein